MKFESQLLKGVAPVVVLEVLSRGPMYGYELSQAIGQRSTDILTLVIRRWGGYPDGVAFAVLLMNMAAPLIDRYTRPRMYGE